MECLDGAASFQGRAGSAASSLREDAAATRPGPSLAGGQGRGRLLGEPQQVDIQGFLVAEGELEDGHRFRLAGRPRLQPDRYRRACASGHRGGLESPAHREAVPATLQVLEHGHRTRQHPSLDQPGPRWTAWRPAAWRPSGRIPPAAFAASLATSPGAGGAAPPPRQGSWRALSLRPSLPRACPGRQPPRGSAPLGLPGRASGLPGHGRRAPGPGRHPAGLRLGAWPRGRSRLRLSDACMDVSRTGPSGRRSSTRLVVTSEEETGGQAQDGGSSPERPERHRLGPARTARSRWRVSGSASSSRRASSSMSASKSSWCSRAARNSALLLRVGQDPGGIAAQQLFRFGPLHGSHLPPSRSSSCFRQRWSQV